MIDRSDDHGMNRLFFAPALYIATFGRRTYATSTFLPFPFMAEHYPAARVTVNPCC